MNKPTSKKSTAKRAETRRCPACAELIPIRLLAAHAELEMQRVQDIIRHVGDAEVLAQADVPDDGAHKRRSALKARQSLTALQPSSRIYSTILADASTTSAAIDHAIGHIARRRRARQARLKELAKEEATWLAPEGEVACPVCSQLVRGDRDVVEAHVDACLLHESRRARLEHGDEDADVDLDTGRDAAGEGSVRTRVITTASLRGTGIHVRRATMDTEDDIDIDGTDDAVFGDAQFAEADVLKASSADVWQPSNHDRQVTPTDDEMDRLDMVILNARSRGDNDALISALEAKLNAIPAPATCRVCLSPYADPTVSTGCWHTCCATCWLRCLGATKLCPMCQRITEACELRRVYL